MSRLATRRKSALGSALISLSSVCFATLALVQARTLPGAETESQGQVPSEAFEAPRPKRIARPYCGYVERHDYQGRFGGHTPVCDALLGGEEGWTELAFMVDPGGKPFEVTVIRSTGNKTFDEVAADAIEHSTFQPAVLNGKPIESGYEMRYLFFYIGLDSGASSGFARPYRELLTAVATGDKAAADAALKKIKIANLYDDANFGLATYSYATRWGNEAQQLEGLRRAIGDEHFAARLPKDKFMAALLECVQLELKGHQYAEAMTHWKRLKKLGVDKVTEAQMEPLIDQLQKLRSDNSKYEVPGVLLDGRWFLHLFKRHFQAVVDEGYISQVKLRCDKRYLYFAFDPKRRYEVASQDGSCSIELLGAPGTRFKLIQF